MNLLLNFIIKSFSFTLLIINFIFEFIKVYFHNYYFILKRFINLLFIPNHHILNHYLTLIYKYRMLSYLNKAINYNLRCFFLINL